MERKHWSPNHPAVMSWHGRGRDSELSLAERRQAVVDRMPARRRDTVKWQALIGLSSMLGSGFVFDHAQDVDGDWWLLTGILLGGGLALLVEAVRQSQGD